MANFCTQRGADDETNGSASQRTDDSTGTNTDVFLPGRLASGLRRR